MDYGFNIFLGFGFGFGFSITLRLGWIMDLIYLSDLDSGFFEHFTRLAVSVVPDAGFLSPTDCLVEAGQAAVAVALRRWFL